MERYVSRMRKRKLQGGKQTIAGATQEGDRHKKMGNVAIGRLSAASKALAIRYAQMQLPTIHQAKAELRSGALVAALAQPHNCIVNCIRV
jgi:hypothetical protein